MKRAGISPRLLAFIVIAAVALFGLAGWFGFVSPQRSKAVTLDGNISDARAQLQVAKVLSGVEQTAKGKKSGLALLTIAMPETLQMPSVIRQVQAIADSSKVTVQSFAPTAATTLAGYDMLPISVQVNGRYAAVEAFLRRLRLQAGSSGGSIHAAGRLFDVSNVTLAPGAGDSPNDLAATIQLSTFIYTGTTPAPPPTTTTDSTGGS